MTMMCILIATHDPFFFCPLFHTFIAIDMIGYTSSENIIGFQFPTRNLTNFWYWTKLLLFHCGPRLYLNVMQVYIVYDNIQDYMTTFVCSRQAFGSKKNSF
jgi:hypothetical protein